MCAFMSHHVTRTVKQRLLLLVVMAAFVMATSSFVINFRHARARLPSDHYGVGYSQADQILASLYDSRSQVYLVLCAEHIYHGCQ